MCGTCEKKTVPLLYEYKQSARWWISNGTGRNGADCSPEVLSNTTSTVLHSQTHGKRRSNTGPDCSCPRKTLCLSNSLVQVTAWGHAKTHFFYVCVCLCVFIIARTSQWTMLFIFAHGNMANVKIGVPENYNGIFPWYLAKVRLLLFVWI